MENSRKPLVAIILVNYNGYTDTVECVKSIRESTYPAYRIIVVDNGSGDAERLQQDAFLKVARQERAVDEQVELDVGEEGVEGAVPRRPVEEAGSPAVRFVDEQVPEVWVAVLTPLAVAGSWRMAG